MRSWLLKLKEHTAFRYIAVGGTSFVIELSVIFGLVSLGNSRELATGIAYWVGLLLAFVLQKLVAFRNYQKEAKALSRQTGLFAVLTIWNWIFTIVVVSLFPASWLLFSRILAQAALSSWNYVLYKKVIFKQG